MSGGEELRFGYKHHFNIIESGFPLATLDPLVPLDPLDPLAPLAPLALLAPLA